MSKFADQARMIVTCLQKTNIGFMISDPKGIILSFNQAYRRLTKLGDKLRVGDSILQYKTQALINGFPSCIQAVREEKTVMAVHDQRDTTGVCIVSKSEPIFNGDRIIYVVTEVQELTDFFNYRDDMENVSRILDNLAQSSHRIADEDSGVVAVSSAMWSVLEQVSQIAKFDIAILLSGESGAGKDVVAHYCHDQSGRKQGPFVAINCAAIPESLLEAELFGYTKGTFTGQQRNGKAGLFGAARGGTLFLDEIGDMPMNLQAKLLRVLESGSYTPLGGIKEISTDVRIVAATNQNIHQMIEEGRFREDLFYRIAGIEIEIPPLRKRRKDIIPLAMQFLEAFNRKYKTHKRFDRQVLNLFLKYRWVGNVRELKNVVKVSAAMSDSDVIDLLSVMDDRIRPQINIEKAASENDLADTQMPDHFKPLKEYVGQYERQYLKKVCQKTGSLRKAAKVLGISHSTLIRKMKAYQLPTH
jgi:TyrR family helix-turn-helix protein